MLLREMDQGEDFVSSLENQLQLYLKMSDKQSAPAKINYAALSNMMQRGGQYGNINYKVFDAAYNQSPAIQAMVKTYGGDGVTLNTNDPGREEPKQSRPDLTKTDQGISATTQQAASSNAQRSLAN